MKNEKWFTREYRKPVMFSWLCLYIYTYKYKEASCTVSVGSNLALPVNAAFSKENLPHSPAQPWDLLIKGTVQQIFRLQFFFTKRLVLVSIDTPKSDFEFCKIFVELFVLKISKIQP
jgi:hypothetical protein